MKTPEHRFSREKIISKKREKNRIGEKDKT